MITKIEEVNFPACYKAADKASLNSQKLYKTLIAINLFLLLAVTIISSFHPDLFKHLRIKEGFDLFSIILLVISLLTSTVIFYFKFEKGWYDGRALAESLKTMVWKYMMAAEPYPVSLQQKEATEKFTSDIRELINSTPNASKILDVQTDGSDQITQLMNDVRQLAFLERKSLYASQRIEKQTKWYDEKASFNRRWAFICSILIIIFQFAAIIFAIVTYSMGDVYFNTLPFLVGLTTSGIAWVELKRHRELSQSYSITKHDLSLIKIKEAYIQNDAELGEFVEESERAISREHTLWLARKGKSEYLNDTNK